MAEDSPSPTRRQALTLVQLEAVLDELRDLYAQTKDDPLLERRRSLLVGLTFGVMESRRYLDQLNEK
jgi:hypothetical protein